MVNSPPFVLARVADQLAMLDRQCSAILVRNSCIRQDIKTRYERLPRFEGTDARHGLEMAERHIRSIKGANPCNIERQRKRSPLRFFRKSEVRGKILTIERRTDQVLVEPNA